MKRRAYLYFVITFVIGIILGAVGLYAWAWNSGRWRRHWNENAAIHNLQKRLDLSSSQVQDLRSILDATDKKYRALQDQARPAFEALHTQTDDNIRKILNSRQAKEFDAFLASRHKKAAAKR
ncbi:MAG: hypothetical protein KGM47_00180 [Acidobacteriota bacterium]|nr:hypothetical protein [Acidobacteriota bacterium]